MYSAVCNNDWISSDMKFVQCLLFPFMAILTTSSESTDCSFGLSIDFFMFPLDALVHPMSSVKSKEKILLVNFSNLFAVKSNNVVSCSHGSSKITNQCKLLQKKY